MNQLGWQRAMETIVGETYLRKERKVPYMWRDSACKTHERKVQRSDSEVGGEATRDTNPAAYREAEQEKKR
ncbi:hypothetical protein GH714_027438 [Hevea brasiliensis]|uniref:Uncharacterized protein n=1 Tax=Hevea brasiliensis TaxID=3981 RepID=A0A6A6MNF7_HEVBR|nr:hypothetical protein GH714_027310 [Hevea brasiliensis]KAF2314541.1 hypothetical protein GH714_027438 [Hevea brasiliensis]